MMVVGCGLVLGCDPPDEKVDAAPAEPVAVEANPPEVEAPPRCAAQGSDLKPASAVSSSTVAVGRWKDEAVAVIADRDEKALVAVSLDPLRERARIPLTGRPEQVLIAPDGRVMTTLADRHQVVVHELGPDGFAERCRRAVPTEPAGMAMTSHGLLVTSRWDARLTLLAGEELETGTSVALPRDPYAISVSEDELMVLVTHVVGGKVSQVPFADGRLGAVETVLAQREQVKRAQSFKEAWEFIPMENGSPQAVQRRSGGTEVHTTFVAQQAFSIARVEEGRFVVPASFADPTPSPMGGTGYGGTSSQLGLPPHVGVNLQLDETGHFDRIADMHRFSGQRFFKHRCLLPRGVAFDPETKSLWVACRGSGLVLGFNRDARQGKTGIRLPWYVLEVPDGPMGVAVEGRRLVVWSEGAAAVSVHPLPKHLERPAQPQDTKLAERELALERHHPLDVQVALGRRLFHLTARRTANDGRACASCHPSGRDDGMTWTTEDGPRQTPILAGRLDDATKPYGWNGRNEALDGHLQRTLERLRGTGLSREERDAIFAYIKQLPVPHHATTGALVQRGRAIYEDPAVGCATCHGLDEATTDGRAHDLGMLATGDRIDAFDTPSLRFVARSAPYFHDGRYPTLEALLADRKSNMGHAGDLPAADRAALEAFLHTL